MNCNMLPKIKKRENFLKINGFIQNMIDQLILTLVVFTIKMRRKFKGTISMSLVIHFLKIILSAHH